MVPINRCATLSDVATRAASAWASVKGRTADVGRRAHLAGIRETRGDGVGNADAKIGDIVSRIREDTQRHHRQMGRTGPKPVDQRPGRVSETAYSSGAQLVFRN
jgi:hypothetical protein